MAPYCAIPRDYLSDTPLLRAIGFLVSQHGQLGAIPPPPFLSVSSLESMRSGGAIPSLERGISAILARYPMKTRQMGAIFGQKTTLGRRESEKSARPYKNKIGTPPPKPKIPKRGILWTWVFLQKERIFPGVHKIGAAISGPRIADRKFYGHEDFSEFFKGNAMTMQF